MPIDLMDSYKQEKEESDAFYANWALGEYDNGDNGCPECGRHRLCICPNGKHRCEKCDWSPEEQKFITL
jgi:hypothetical protein